MNKLNLNIEEYDRIRKAFEENEKKNNEIETYLNNQEDLRCDYTTISLEETMNINSIKELEQYYQNKKRDKDNTPIPKGQYINIVKFTLESMLDLAKTDKAYHFPSDLLYYYNNKIKKDNILSKNEFSDICNELGISTKILEE